MTVKNADQTAVAAQTSSIAATLTTHVQSGCTANSNAVVSVNSVTQAANGDLQLTYTCSGVSDHDTCQQSLNTAAQSPAIQQTVGKCSQSSDTTSKPTQKPTAAPAATTKAAATTKKPETQAPDTTKKPETQAPPTTKKPETQAPPTTKKPETQAPPTTKKPETQAPPTTKKPETQAPPTTKKPETQAPPTTKKPADTTKASVQSSTKSGKKMSRLILIILSY